jgi:Holliday junction resolvase
MTPEKRFETKVKRFLKEQGCWFIKYWGGGSYTKAGIPDLLCCINGHFVAVELKSDHGTPSPLQMFELEEIDQAGGYAILLYPEKFEEFCKLVIDLNKERKV